MKKIFIFFTSVAFLLLFTSPKGQVTVNEKYYRDLFDSAEKLFNGEATDASDSLALADYTTIVKELSPSTSNAKLLYDCHERIGILEQGLGASSAEILQHYYKGIELQKKFSLPDSILFRLYLSAGNVHYAEGLFDSSVFYFSKAEKIIQQYPDAGLAGDLYNSLGALYSESGDYLQSANYFKKALEITKATRPYLGQAIFAMSANVASSLRLSGNLDSAVHLYKQLLQPGAPATPLLNNLGRIYLTKKMPDSALFFLQQVTDAGVYAIGYNNALALAYMQKKDTANAAKYLSVATASFTQSASGGKNNVYGATCRYLGDLRTSENKLQEALQYYQQAIIQLDYKFNSKNVFDNPGNFIGDFASYELFNAILAKANCFAGIYKQEKKSEYFNGAVNTYDSAFALADYIKKSIDNDEARLFIADKVFSGYQDAINFILSSDSSNIESINLLALKWISKSRATSLAISVKENSIKQFAGLPDSLLQKEKNSKIAISRLKLQLQQVTDSAGISDILSQLNSAELQLSQLINSYRQYPGYYHQKFAADSVDIKNIQEHILDNTTAVICYFETAGELNAFVIKHSAVLRERVQIEENFPATIETYVNSLSATATGKSSGDDVSKKLFNVLIQPLQEELDGINSLIIIPDEALVSLPFESLLTNDNTFLVEKYAVTYQYALPFLQLNTRKIGFDKSLAVAPFAAESYGNFAALQSSKEELTSFNSNEQLLNANATKQSFITKAASATVIHLATHAVVNFSEPANSYITFYPVTKQDSSYKLFAHELYNLQLPNTQLVFLSACETGAGKLSQSEGALSLSRAFAYAGCSNIITSLWKAEDRSTAYISTHFYEYLKKGYTYPVALQKAKTDLLHDASMSQFHAPQYWSHLIFIGDVQQAKSSFVFWLSIAAAFIIIAVVVFSRKRKLRSIAA